MNRLLDWLSAAGDRVNPVAIREFRQAVQNRLVIAILVGFLLLNLSVVGGYLLLSPDAGTSTDGGQTVFMFLQSVLLMTCIGFVPLYSGIRLSLERNDVNMDLLFITTLTPGAILRGKYFTSTALTMLIFSICMPFMTLTYLLRGIDLPTIFLTLAHGFLVCMLANAAGIFVGCIAGNWFLRGLAAGGMFLGLLGAIGVMVEIVESTVMFGMGLALTTWEFWVRVAVGVLLEFLVIGLLHVLSVAMLSPHSSNRMFLSRIYIGACWTIVGIAFGAWSWIASAFWPMTVWMIGSGAAFMLMLIVSLGERDTWSIRIRRTIPRNRFVRFFAFLLFTGSAGGMLWYSLLFAATVSIAFLWLTTFPAFSRLSELYDACATMLHVYVYALVYCLTIACLRIYLLKSIPTRHLSALVAFLAVAIYLFPSLIAFLLSEDWWYVVPWYLVGSPLVLATVNESAKAFALVFLLAWLAVCLLGSLPWVIGQWRRFTPHEQLAVVDEIS